MPASVARKFIEPEVDSKTRDNIAPGDKSLYYKNEGLFSDPYLEGLPKTRGDSFILQNWDTFDLPEFSECYEWMLSTWSELKDILPKLSEDQLREKWINPILQRLGWEYQVEEKVQRWGKSQRPDYSLFESQGAWKKAQGCPNRDEGYFKHITAIAEAKEMGSSLDSAKLNNTNPSFQIIAYLMATGKEWGILTDGRYWRLYSTKSKSTFRAYYEVNIEKFLADRDDDQFLYFFNFFRKLAFLKETATNQSFLDVVFESGEHYAREVETKLKDRAFELVELIAQGFSAEHQPKTEQELRAIYEHSLYFLFRLLFVLNCEAKGLLSVHRNTDFYPYSLRSLCLKIKQEYEANLSWARIAKSYNHISDLFQLLATGDDSIGLHGFGKEVFSSGDRIFYKNNPIPDSHLNKVLLTLAFAEYGKRKELRFIDYKRLSADHLGSLFEGLLEYKLVLKSKNVSLVNSSGERKSSGSYYTPEKIVDYIVKETLEPLTKEKSVDEVLEIKVIDPAMGSGHFLLGSVRYLEQVILTKLNEEGGGKEFKQGVNWAVLHSCIYGLDKNPMAVELAKFSLWMYTAKNGYELEPLSNQLICADTLLDTSVWVKNFSEICRGPNAGFSACIGNPPYIRIQGMFESDEHADMIKKNFKTAAHGNFDAYVLFVEKALSIISNKGRVGFIIPHKFMSAEYGAPIRNLLANGKHVERLIHFGDVQIFPEATTYTCILFLSNRSVSSFESCKLKSMADLELPINWEKCKSSNLTGDPWILSDKVTQSLLQKLNDQPERLKNLVDKIYVGLQTSADRIYILEVRQIKKTELLVYSKASEKEFWIEKEIMRPLLKGAEISRYNQPVAESVIIFPYNLTDGKAVPLSQDEFKKNYPKAFLYLSQFKEQLKSRNGVHGESWWVFGRSQNIDLFQYPKIIMQVLSHSGKFFHDKNGEYYFVGGGTAGGNAVKLKEEDPRLAKIILGVLNSAVTTFFVSQVGSAFRGGFYAFAKSSLNDLPVPKINLREKSFQKLARLVEYRESADSQTEIKKLDDQINEIIFDLYGLNEEQRATLLDLSGDNLMPLAVAA